MGGRVDSGNGTGEECRAHILVAFVMLRSWDTTMVKLQGERIKGQNEGYMCR